MNSLIVSNITKIYGKSSKRKVNVLENASAKWEQGKIHALVGKNGAGKTTLFKIICGLSAQDGGSITIPPTIGSLGFKYKSKIAYLSPNGGLHPRLTIKENILSFKSICVKNSTFMNDCDDIEKIISGLKLSKYLDCYPSEVSTGIIQKARIAQILGINPKVILLDEPTSGLDINAKLQVYKILKELRSKNRIILMATHDISEISGICESLSVVCNGGIKQHFFNVNDSQENNNIESIYKIIENEIRPEK